MFTTWQRALALGREGGTGAWAAGVPWAKKKKGWLDSIALSYVNGAVCAHKVDRCCYGSGALMSTSSKMHFTTAAGWESRAGTKGRVTKKGGANSLWSTGSKQRKHATSTATIILQLTPNNSQTQNDKQLSSALPSPLVFPWLRHWHKLCQVSA